MNDDTTNFQFEGNNPFDPDAEWARSTDFQRHTLRLNGLWRGPWGINIVGRLLLRLGQLLLHDHCSANPFGAVTRAANRYVTAPVTVPAGVQDRFDGPTSFAVGDLVPRNALKGDPLHRVDMRLSKDFTLPGGMRISLIAEVFNLLNHKNYGAYQSVINNARVRRSAPEPAERLSAARRRSWRSRSRSRRGPGSSPGTTTSSKARPLSRAFLVSAVRGRADRQVVLAGEGLPLGGGARAPSRRSSGASTGSASAA